jgi:hypothetical protein
MVASELDFRHASAADETGLTWPAGLSESEGYLPMANFNGNPVATFFGEKQLSG